MEGSRSGAFGDPTLATVAKGEAILVPWWASWSPV
jgi:hypothetical protein